MSDETKLQKLNDAISEFNAALLSEMARRKGVPFLAGLPNAEVAARLPDGLTREAFDAVIATHPRRSEINPERVWEIYSAL
jgi:hypothetical protein